jgi:hypothetical protein
MTHGGLRSGLLLFFLVITGCAAGHAAVIGPSGGTAYSIWCRRSMTNCYREAGEVCPGGYTIMDSRNGLLIECRPVSAAR